MASSQDLKPLGPDDVISIFLSSSPHLLDPEMSRAYQQAENSTAFLKRSVLRQLMDRLGVLDHLLEREWFRARLTPHQQSRIFLGHEAGNSFSKYYSNSTYRIDVAARNLLARAESENERAKHQRSVFQYARHMEETDAGPIILCASRYCLNRELKVFDGNHRLLAFYLRNRRLPDTEYIVGFSKSFAMNLLQRALLGFPFWDKMKASAVFHARQEVKRILFLVRGGVSYQPILSDGRSWRRVTDPGTSESDVLREVVARGERPSLDRARLIHNDLKGLYADFGNRTLLDIGCNVGFFCHYFESLGFRATGVDDSRHNRGQRFSHRNCIRTAKRLNDKYGLRSEFVDGDALEFVRREGRVFDVVLALSVIHHFFLGYTMGRGRRNSVDDALEFMRTLDRITGDVLYVEHEPSPELGVEDLMELLSKNSGLASVAVIGQSQDFGRPIVRARRISPRAERDR